MSVYVFLAASHWMTWNDSSGKPSFSPSVFNDTPGRALFERAETKFNVGRFDEALVDYQAAYEIEPPVGAAESASTPKLRVVVRPALLRTTTS